MAERITAIARPGAPGSALTESARERAWADVVGRRRDPEVVPSVPDSWVRSRDVFHVDPALERSPIVLPEDERCRRRERLDALRAGAPVLERFGDHFRRLHRPDEG